MFDKIYYLCIYFLYYVSISIKILSYVYSSKHWTLKLSGIRVLDGPITDSMEAIAFNKHLDINDIYSCSWGPEDDAKTLDGPHPLAQAALIHGVTAGRQGFGSVRVSIFVYLQ